jgi:hypothetical protein
LITWLREDVLRKVLRKVHYGKNRSSYPFLSGDTFRANCAVRIDELNENYISRISPQDLLTKTSIFLRADFGHFLVEKLSKEDAPDFSNWQLVLHNSDKIPDLNDLQFLASKFEKVFCVNWLGSKSIATPIPIGLENFSYLQNGVPKDFSLQNRPFAGRNVELLTAFSDSTNPEERQKARLSVANISSNLNLQVPVKPSAYRNILSDTKFVLSPPGNGPDCHRTWEAIYLGAIPIVKRNFWPFESIDLPVLIVDHWEDTAQAISEYRYKGTIAPERIAGLFLNSFVSKRALS